jgi:hypothetical protein
MTGKQGRDGGVARSDCNRHLAAVVDLWPGPSGVELRGPRSHNAARDRGLIRICMCRPHAVGEIEGHCRDRRPPSGLEVGPTFESAVNADVELPPELF